MYEQPILREHHGPFVELARLSDYRSSGAHATHDLYEQRDTFVSIAVRVLAVAVGVAPAVIGFATYHPIVGSAVSCCVAGLIAFGRSVLDETIELY